MRLLTCLSILPFVLADAHPEPDARPGAQTYNNYQPFLGAIYLIDPNGQPVQAPCPALASLSCGDQGHPSWCCPGGCSCLQQQNQNGYIGCCPAGQTCSGSVLVQTVTVTAYAQRTEPAVNPLQYTTTTNWKNDPYTAPAAAGFCQTLTMRGPGLPTITSGSCGTVLIVNGNSRNWMPLGFGVAGVLLLVQLTIARILGPT